MEVAVACLICYIIGLTTGAFGVVGLVYVSPSWLVVLFERPLLQIQRIEVKKKSLKPLDTSIEKDIPTRTLRSNTTPVTPENKWKMKNTIPQELRQRRHAIRIGASSLHLDQSHGIRITNQRTDQEMEAMKKLVTVLGQVFDPQQHDDAMLLRFLRARGYDPERAAQMMTAYLNWKDEFKPNEVDPKTVLVEIKRKKAYFHGFDKQNRPVVMLFSGRHNPREADVPTIVRFAVLMLETAIQKMPQGVEKFCLIADFTGYSIANMHLELVKNMLTILQNYYPERLGSVFLIEYPLLINALWRTIKPLLDPHTQEKVNFVRDTSQLTDYFELHYLPSHLGGTSQYIPADESYGLETLDPEFLKTYALNASQRKGK